MIIKCVERNENKKVSFKVEFARAEFESALNKVYLKNRNRITVPGFRKGKAPRMVIEGMYGQDIFYDDAVNDLSPGAFEFVVEQEDIKPVGKPSVTEADISDEKELTLTFETAVYPEVTLGQYKNIEAPKSDVEVPEEDIDSELESVRTRNARQITADRPAKTGDIAVIDFEGFLDGVPFEGGKGAGHSLKLGSGQFVPGFEEQLEGMSAGDEKDINITFPENYHENLAGKAVVFHVKLNEVKENELPELDDEFAKDVSEYDTLAEYRDSIRDSLKTKREGKSKEEFNEKLLIKAIENMTVEIPDAMIDEQQEIIVREYAQNLAMQGMRLENYLGMMGMDYQMFYNSARPTALRQVQSELLLTKVAEEESIDFTSDDIESEYLRLVGLYNSDIETVKKAISEKSVLHDLKMKRAAELIYESGVPTALEPVPETENGGEEKDDKEKNE